MKNHKQEIRYQISRLAEKGYDHDGEGSLPIRPDVSHFATADLFSSHSNGLYESLLCRVDESEVELHGDGTITVTLAFNDRHLFLDVPCGGIVTYVKQFEDQATKVEGVIRTGWPTVLGSAIREIDALIEWLVQE